MCKNLRVEEDFSFTALAQHTPGFVGADLMALTREAAMVAVDRYSLSTEMVLVKCLYSTKTLYFTIIIISSSFLFF